MLLVLHFHISEENMMDLLTYSNRYMSNNPLVLFSVWN